MVLLAAAGTGVLAAGTVGALAADPASKRAASEARLMDSARSIVAAGPAVQGTPAKAQVEALLRSRLEPSDAWVRRIPFSVELKAIGARWDLVNLVASFHKEAKHRVMIGAHWDIRPWADEDPDPTKRKLPFDGANDGASGVAILLELARALGETPPPEGIGVDLVFFDGEEGPKGALHENFLGSKELAERWFTTGVTPPYAGIIVDMVGRKGTRIRREVASQRRAGAVQDEIFAVAKAMGSQVFVDEPGIHILDDHTAFLDRGIPVVDLIDIEDPAWHTHADTLDKLDPAVMAEVTDVVLGWIRSQRPR
ncbi:M28 family peptidase [Vulgatibacter incomptus]|nr:M28 family peptidase [Vulgatibacter incomptus]